MDNNTLSSSVHPLSSDDLEEIDRFLVAWCEENNVEKTSSRALEVASALIDWYSSNFNYKRSAKLDSPPVSPASEKIDGLLLKLK